MSEIKITRREGLLAMGAGTAAVALGSGAAVAKKFTGEFNQENIKWYTLEGIDNLFYHILKVDLERKVVDILFKLPANKKVILHRHHADYSTFIIQGELRIFDKEGTLKEIRPTGSFVKTKAGGVHEDGSGDMDCIAWFSNWGTDGMIYEILDPSMNTLATLGLKDFAGLLEAQETPVQPIFPG